MSIAGNLDDFRTLCEKSEFPHRELLLTALRSDGISLSKTDGDGVPSRSMLDIYRLRLMIGEERTPDTNYAHGILSDIRFFISELERLGEDRIRIWHLEPDDGATHFSVFESENKNTVVGCVYGVDRREVTAEEWNRLWNGN